MTTASPKNAVWADLNFLRLWFASTLSALGDSAFFIVLGWFVIDVTKSQFALGSTLTLAAIPRLVLMLMGGVVADRVNRKLILLFSLSTRAILLLLFAGLLVLQQGHLHLVPIYILAMLFGTVDAFYWPANGSIVPQVVDAPLLSAANSWIQIAQQLSMFLGPLIASGLLFMRHFSAVYIGIAVLYLASVSVLLTLRVGTPRHPAVESGAAVSLEAAPTSTAPAPSASVWGDLVQGIRYVLSVRILTLLMIVSLVINLFFMGPINIGVPVAVHSMGWQGSTYGGFEASLGIGAIVGGLACNALHGMRGHFRWLGAIGSVTGVCMGFLAIVHVAWFGMALMGAMGVVLSLMNIPIITYIQTIVGTAQLGRVMSLLSLMSMGLVPVSYAVSSFVLQRGVLTVRSLFIVCGVAEAVILLACILFRDFRQMESHPLWQKTARHSAPTGDVEGVGVS